MLESMTGYGKGQWAIPHGLLVLEIHSVNRKALDIQVSLPRHLLRFEIFLRNKLARYVHRGQLTIRVVCTGDPVLIHAADYITRLQQAKTFWEHVASSLGYDPSMSVDLRFLCDTVGRLSLEELDVPDTLWEEALGGALVFAIEAWKGMRQKEGVALQEELSKALHRLQSLLANVERHIPQATEGYRAKLTARLTEYCRDAIANEERVMREVVVLTEKLDPTEEVARLRSHFEQLEELLLATEQKSGKMIEFLVQEMHREINTLSAKSADVDIARLVMAMKGDVDKIREQAQNIE